MDRESRYIVIKRKDVDAYLNADEKDRLCAICESVNGGRAIDNKPEITCVVIESDWPEYDDTWMAIAQRVDKEEGNFDSALQSRIDQIERYEYS